MKNIFKRHTRHRDATQAGIKAIGMKLFASEGHGSPAITSVETENINAEDLRKMVQDRFDRQQILARSLRWLDVDVGPVLKNPRFGKMFPAGSKVELSWDPIEGAKDYLGQRLDVVVTGALQTPTGRMVFSKLEKNPPTNKSDKRKASSS